VNTNERRPRWRRLQSRKPRSQVVIDLPDFLNLVASAEDWAGFGADAREPEEPMKRFTIDVPVELHRRVRAACARVG